MDHPTPFAQGVQDSTPSGMFFGTQQAAVSAAQREGGSSWVSVGPSWGPSELPVDLGVIPPKYTEGEGEIQGEGVEGEGEEQYEHKRRFDERDLTIAFLPREEFGKRKPGFVFRYCSCLVRGMGGES